MGGKNKKIKFSVGYQLKEEEIEESIVDLCGEFRENISEIYFPWSDMPSGRAPLIERNGYVNWEGQQQLVRDLKDLRKLGLRLNLLFNANCYGRYALSEYLRNKIASIIDYLNDKTGGADIVTTSSLAVAETIKKYAPEIDVRASVNMRIGTVQGMEYVSGIFDSYYVQREYNRNMKHLSTLKEWAEKNGKELFILANSGCLNYCSAQTFHDNAVAHEKEISEIRNIEGASSHICWRYYKNREKLYNFLNGSWIRPEDIDRYENITGTLKIAMRMHSRPRLVLQAYAERKFTGNLLDLLEPSFSAIFAPYIIDNGKFPADWFENISCRQGDEVPESYYKRIFEQVAVKL